MVNNFEKLTIELKLRREVESGHSKLILYPFGELGQYVKKILNNDYNIYEYLIIDNNISMEGVYPLKYLQSYLLQDEYVLVTSRNPKIYDEIRNELKKYVPEDRIIDLFEKESFVYQIAENYDEYAAEVSGFDFENNIYSLKKYNVKFYLPFWKTDLIQREILFRDQYYENRLLYFVTKIFRGGG